MAPPSTPGFGYDGTGMVTATGNLTIGVSAATDLGSVAMDLDVPSGPAKGHYSVEWTDFHAQPGQGWQDNGVACGPRLFEHGASGFGNKMEPQVDLLCGGWGSAKVLRDGQPVADPATGSTVLNAHFMVTKEAILQGGKVLKADRTTPFDPHAPGDGSVDASRMEAHAAFWSTGAYANGIAVAPRPSTAYLNDTATGAVAPGPTYSRSQPIAVAAGSTAHLHLDLDGSDPPGQVTLRLRSPNGDSFATTAGLGVATRSADFDVPGTLRAGNHTMEVEAQGARMAYHAAVTVTPPTPFLLHVVFQDVRVG